MSKPFFNNIEAIRAAFNQFRKSPNWGLFKGAELITSYSGSDDDESEDNLMMLLQALETSGNTDTYTLRLYNNPEGDIHNKTKYNQSFYFRVQDGQEYVSKARSIQVGLAPGYYPRGTAGNPADQLKTYLDEKFTGLDERLAKLEAPEDPEDMQPQDEPVSQAEVIMGGIQKILDHPLVGKILEHPGFTGFIMNFFSRFAPMTTQAQPVSGFSPGNGTSDRPQAEMVNNDEKVEKLNADLGRLAAHCDLFDTIERLANLADNQPKFFQTLLGQLKAM